MKNTHGGARKKRDNQKRAKNRDRSSELVLHTKVVKSSKRMQAGLDYLIGLGPNDHHLSAVELRKNICTEGTQAGDVLRTVLREVEGYIVGVRNTKYEVNSAQLLKLLKRYRGIRVPAILQHSSPRALHRFLQLQHQNPFSAGIPRTQGICKGYRYYNAVTSMERNVRVALLGHGWDYDIKAAMPTILYQRHLQLGGPVLPTWAKLVNDRTAFRQTLADFTGLSVPVIKEILSAVLNGGALVENKMNGAFSIYRDHGPHRHPFEDFKAHPYMVGLIEEGKTLYDTVCPKDERERVTKVNEKGEEKTRVKSRGRNQYEVYVELEDQIMSVVASEIEKDGEQSWFIHDGFLMRRELTKDELQNLIKSVKEKTGFDIEIDADELVAGPEVDIKEEESFTPTTS